MLTKNVFGDAPYGGHGLLIVLEIDGEKKLLKNGTWGEYVVTTDDEIVKIGKLKQSKTFPDTVMGMVEVGDKVVVLDKKHTLKVVADSITFDLPVGTVMNADLVRYSKYGDNWRRSASLTKTGKEKLL